MTGAIERFIVDHGEPERIYIAVSASGALVSVHTKVTVATNDAAQISSAIVGIVALMTSRRNRAKAQQSVVECEKRPLLRALFRADDEPPPAIAQKPVIAARDQLRTI